MQESFSKKYFVTHFWLLHIDFQMDRRTTAPFVSSDLLHLSHYWNFVYGIILCPASSCFTYFMICILIINKNLLNWVILTLWWKTAPVKRQQVCHFPYQMSHVIADEIWRGDGNPLHSMVFRVLCNCQFDHGGNKGISYCHGLSHQFLILRKYYRTSDQKKSFLFCVLLTGSLLWRYDNLQINKSFSHKWGFFSFCFLNADIRSS